MMIYRKRTVIVTGASRGLGRFTAVRFGTAGDRIAVLYRENETAARSVADSIQASGGDALVLQADVRDPAAVKRAVDVVTGRWGAIDVLVNNAGVVRDGLVLKMTEQDWDEVLDADLKGPFLCIRAVVRTMMKQRGGHIINISSITGVQGREGQVNYSAAKAGLIGVTKAAARELGRYDIKVNAVLPGYLETSMGRTVGGSIIERIKRENVLGRANDPEEVAAFIYHLSCMQNISGQVFNLDSRII
jgi:3-oxoacyl-[acyl-carrier protein] reductase